MLTPNDVRAGDMINTADGTTFIVKDNKKGIRRQVQDLQTKDTGVAYVFDWYCRLSSKGGRTVLGTVGVHDTERITLPAKYREAADVIGRTIDVTCLPGPTPEPVKLGSLRHAWKGAIEIEAVDTDVSYQFPTDGAIMFDGGRLTKRDTARLLRRRQDRQCTLKSARDIWQANIDAATIDVIETDVPASKTWGANRPLQGMIVAGKVCADGTTFIVKDNKKGIRRRVQDLLIYVDASKYVLACKVGKVQRWKAAGKAAGMVGYNKAGKATVVIMPVVLNR
tara:strand:+ start:143 stop:982 length:840 start_codon:yes stop_codon:yes gene_type:complete